MKNTKKVVIGVIVAIVFILIVQTEIYAQDEEIDITSKFVDKNLQSSILELAKQATNNQNKTNIYESDIEKIVEQPGGTSLKLANKGIKDLSGLEEFANKGITWIFLDWNEIEDLTPLSDFKNLTQISFSGNKVEDLTPLSNLKDLQNIIAINNKIKTIKPLSNLINIEYVCLDGNQLENIDIIYNWKNATEISFANNNINKIPTLSNLLELRRINLMGNNIETISNIGNVENLEKLEVDNNQMSTLDGIQNLKGLKYLSCSNNSIKDITQVTELLELENININKNQVQDIKSIKKNQKVKYIYMDNNSIFNFNILKEIPNLKKYSIYNQNVIIEIKEKLTQEYALVPLPELYTELYNQNSFLYNSKLTTKVIGTEKYEIDNNNKNIKLSVEDLKNNDIIIQVSDNINTILNYTIQLDKTAPIIKGIENGKVYFSAVTPTTKDDDINKVELIKDNNKIAYEIGNEIKETGTYRLVVTDRAGNETKISFEIKNEIDQGEQYKTDKNYILQITERTSSLKFKENLNGNVPYKIYKGNQVIGENQIIATGDQLVTDNGTIFYLIVTGDITKDGNTNIRDAVKMRRYLLQKENFDDCQKKAANITKENNITIKDLVAIRKMIIKK